MQNQESLRMRCGAVPARHGQSSHTVQSPGGRQKGTCPDIVNAACPQTEWRRRRRRCGLLLRHTPEAASFQPQAVNLEGAERDCVRIIGELNSDCVCVEARHTRSLCPGAMGPENCQYLRGRVGRDLSPQARMRLDTGYRARLHLVEVLRELEPL